MTATDASEQHGPNDWLIDEMRARWNADPASVDHEWRVIFDGENGTRTAATTSASTLIETTARSITADPHPPRQPPAAAPAPPGTGTVPPRQPPAAAPAPPGTGTVPPRQPTAAAPVAPGTGAVPPRQPTAAAPVAPGTGTVPPRQPTAAAPVAPGTGTAPIRGSGARIVANMEASLGVPTATSFREVPAKLLEVNRKIINGYLGRKMSDKVSFTHLIGYAVVRAIADEMPVMNNSFSEGPDGGPTLVRNPHVALGVAVDIAKSDGSRTLMVPCIKQADTLNFREFANRYEDTIRRVRNNELSPDDLTGTTVTLTNPGTIGTLQSVPRLMPGQGLIVGVGTIAYPTGFEAADPATLADLGLSKVVTITSTYDHRIIQGAESGMFLRKVHDLLLGSDDFYVKVFQSLEVPYEAVQWRRDVNPVDREGSLLEKQAKVNQLINMYRVRGHLIADLDPLQVKEPKMHAELDPATYGLTIWDLDREFLTGTDTGIYAMVGDTPKMALGDLLGVLRDAYCRTVGVEYMHIQDPVEKRWMQEQLEGADSHIEPDEQRHILSRLNAAEALETFLGTKYLGQKRFGIEGAESTIPLVDGVLGAAADSRMAGAVMGMAHRGRLNVLVNIVGKTYKELFIEFEGGDIEQMTQGSGDVKYHLGQKGVFVSRNGNELPLELAANPSHLEAVDPVVVGMARAQMDLIDPESGYGRFPVLPLLIHGDAAFAGQGVVAETLNLSQIQGYRVGGTIHVIINNQLGFTTTPDVARSSEYSTDVAKMIQAPIFHVNGDDPEACVRVARLAFAYRQRFNKDVVIDMICYRRHGHNEGDDPSYTLPEMYRRVDARPSVRAHFTEALTKRGDLTPTQAEEALADFRARLQSALDETRGMATDPDARAAHPPQPVGVLPHVRTSIDHVSVQRIYRALSIMPDGFTLHPKLAVQFEKRDEMFSAGEVDWALAEAMALGSLLLEGNSIRLAGQDPRRGTFSHRHSTLVDYQTSAEYVPLATLASGDTRLWIYDSLLSEYAALGFEYGYSIANREALVMWEAQFGDFANGAQIIIDQFIVAAKDKWNEETGLVMLLPHGLEGQGPEHSSARVERYLLLAAEDNMQICNATTAAQFFHLLRRQTLLNVRVPLIVFTPKSLLRARASRSPVGHLLSGTFEEVLKDPGEPDPASVRRVVLASGKVAVDALAQRDRTGAPVAIVRVEQLYPWPYDAIAAQLARYWAATELVWLQEEPENMGPWNAIKGRLYEAHEQTHSIRRVSRVESGSPACGSAKVHAQEHAELLGKALNL
ncbi:MAG: multifunctional oxoglutarate decarboxylase/oxoglutarate dehydrogenase thiamine pyrophosphate-binding subunit/dihydrolipoyllysine-residue succinyltransferase subunit [Acidimicrobiaceae bacterium]|nr:multifunctional oxoglutarate decarboxylase/oxoglutarate dehydrogenase thiamine pyrophosphate-binding subunit/dihydrolipoyllysine-residue succinyltransferase subunit [Acidimicrobiaceae bacterium]